MMLDSIIRSLSLTLVDADDPSTSRFPSGSVPTIRTQKFQPSTARFSDQPPVRILRDTSSAQHPSFTRINGEDDCLCNSMTLRECWPMSREHAPLWGATPAWNKDWSEGEIRKESCRRLCWSSSILAAGHVSYTMAHRSKGLDLFISNPANVRYPFHMVTLFFTFFFFSMLSCFPVNPLPDPHRPLFLAPQKIRFGRCTTDVFCCGMHAFTHVLIRARRTLKRLILALKRGWRLMLLSQL